MASGEEREDGEVIIAGPEDRRQTILPQGDDGHMAAVASGLSGSRATGRVGALDPGSLVGLSVSAYGDTLGTSSRGGRLPQAGQGTAAQSDSYSLNQTITALPSKGKLLAGAEAIGLSV